MESYWFCIYKIMLSANRENWTSLFLTCMLFISFSCPNVLSRTPSTMPNRSGDSRHNSALNFRFINPTAYSTSLTKHPRDISKLTCLDQSPLSHLKMFESKFSSLMQACLRGGEGIVGLFSFLIIPLPLSVAPLQYWTGWGGDGKWQEDLLWHCVSPCSILKI